MKIRDTCVVFDAADIDAVSTFWAGVMGGEVWKDDEEGWYAVLVDGRQVIGVQHAPNHIRPQWPGGAQQQVHLDIYVEDLEAPTYEPSTPRNGQGPTRPTCRPRSRETVQPGGSPH